jgi:hypothetical protein
MAVAVLQIGYAPGLTYALQFKKFRQTPRVSYCGYFVDIPSACYA